MRELQDKSGSTKLMKDIVVERRMALLEQEFQKIEATADHAQVGALLMDASQRLLTGYLMRTVHRSPNSTSSTIS